MVGLRRAHIPVFIRCSPTAASATDNQSAKSRWARVDAEEIAFVTNHGDGVGCWALDPETARERKLFLLSSLPLPPGQSNPSTAAPSTGISFSRDFRRLAMAIVQDGTSNVWIARVCGSSLRMAHWFNARSKKRVDRIQFLRLTDVLSRISAATATTPSCASPARRREARPIDTRAWPELDRRVAARWNEDSDRCQTRCRVERGVGVELHSGRHSRAHTFHRAAHVCPVPEMGRRQGSRGV